MIELVLDPYCHNCPEFDPVVDKDIHNYASFDMRDGGETIYAECDTRIICEHKLRCYSMRDHIKKELDAEKEATDDAR